MSGEEKSFLDSLLEDIPVEKRKRRIESPVKIVNLLDVKKEAVEVEEEEFEVEKVLEKRTDIWGITWYLVSWAAKEKEGGVQSLTESWTEEENLPSFLKEEFEGTQRKMGGDGGDGGDGRDEDNGIGERKAKKIKLAKDTGGDVKAPQASQVVCPVEGCGKPFKDQRSLSVHLGRWCRGIRSNFTVGVALVGANCDDGGGIGGAGNSPGDVEILPVATPPPSIIVQIDGEDDSDMAMNSPPPPPPASSDKEGGNGGKTSRAITTPLSEEEEEEEGQRNDDLSTTSSSSSSDGHHVEDGEVPGTSASSVQPKTEIKVEGKEEGLKLVRKVDALVKDFVGAQTSEISRMKETLQKEISRNKDAQSELSKERALVRELKKTLEEEEDKTKKIEVKLEEEQRKRREIQEKLAEEETKRKMAEEELLSCQHLNQEFAQRWKVFQDAQKEIGEMAARCLEKEVEKNN